jgi:hypothetical protein
VIEALVALPLRTRAGFPGFLNAVEELEGVAGLAATRKDQAPAPRAAQTRFGVKLLMQRGRTVHRLG